MYKTMITGLFELHLIVDNTPTADAKLFRFCLDQKERKDLINVRATCAQSFYGRYPRQSMLTCMFNGNQVNAIKVAQQLSIDMEIGGMRVMRIKVESMAHNPGVPTTISYPNYFEFHFKVAITTSKQWDTLAAECVKFGSHLFFNSFSEKGKMQPVVTLRRYRMLIGDAEKKLDELLEKLTSLGFTYESIEREYSVLDTYVFMDSGWLFKQDPESFTTAL